MFREEKEFISKRDMNLYLDEVRSLIVMAEYILIYCYG